VAVVKNWPMAVRKKNNFKTKIISAAKILCKASFYSNFGLGTLFQQPMGLMRTFFTVKVPTAKE
jgi:hypothetical protein